MSAKFYIICLQRRNKVFTSTHAHYIIYYAGCSISQIRFHDKWNIYEFSNSVSFIRKVKTKICRQIYCVNVRFNIEIIIMCQTRCLKSTWEWYRFECENNLDMKIDYVQDIIRQSCSHSKFQKISKSRRKETYFFSYIYIKQNEKTPTRTFR